LFHYNQVDGTITYLKQRGPKKPGDRADSTRSGLPVVSIHGTQHKAAAVAWALAHGVDPAPQHVWCLDGNPRNLARHNLCLQDDPPVYLNPRGRRARRPGWYRRDLKRDRVTGEWSAKYDGLFLGRFGTQEEAALARRLAAERMAADG